MFKRYFRRWPAVTAVLAAVGVAVAVAVPALAVSNSTVLAGVSATDGSVDVDPAGTAEAFDYTATASGTTNTLNVFISAQGTSTPVKVGVYTNSVNDDPGTLLASASTTIPSAATPAAWYRLTLSSSVSLTQGTHYWIAILSTADGVDWNDDQTVTTGARAETDSNTSLSGLPSTWSPGTGQDAQDASFFLSDAAPPSSVVGNSAIETQVTDENPSGEAEAFSYTANSSTTISSLNWYMDSGSSATTVKVGIYSDNAGVPGTLLRSATISSPSAGWNTASITSLSVTAGNRYWLAALGTNGQIKYRDENFFNSNFAQTDSGTGLSALPSTWSAGTGQPNISASFFAS